MPTCRRSYVLMTLSMHPMCPCVLLCVRGYDVPAVACGQQRFSRICYSKDTAAAKNRLVTAAGTTYVRSMKHETYVPVPAAIGRFCVSLAMVDP